jgi:hypothetical protein
MTAGPRRRGARALSRVGPTPACSNAGPRLRQAAGHCRSRGQPLARSHRTQPPSWRARFPCRSAPRRRRPARRAGRGNLSTNGLVPQVPGGLLRVGARLDRLRAPPDSAKHLSHHRKVAELQQEHGRDDGEATGVPLLHAGDKAGSSARERRQLPGPGRVRLRPDEVLRRPEVGHDEGRRRCGVLRHGRRDVPHMNRLPVAQQLLGARPAHGIEQVIAVEPRPARSHLDQPRPHVLGWRVDRDGSCRGEMSERDEIVAGHGIDRFRRSRPPPKVPRTEERRREEQRQCRNHLGHLAQPKPGARAPLRWHPFIRKVAGHSSVGGSQHSHSRRAMTAAEYVRRMRPRRRRSLRTIRPPEQDPYARAVASGGAR